MAALLLAAVALAVLATAFATLPLGLVTLLLGARAPAALLPLAALWCVAACAIAWAAMRRLDRTAAGALVREDVGLARLITIVLSVIAGAGVAVLGHRGSVLGTIAAACLLNVGLVSLAMTLRRPLPPRPPVHG